MYAALPCPRAVLFDFFGTLTRAVRRGPAHALIAHWLGLDPAAYIAVLDRTFYERACGRYGRPVDVLRRIAHELGASPDDATLAAAALARIDAVRSDTDLRPDAVHVLARLRAQGIRTAVVSDCWYELPAFLPDLPVWPLLDACVYSLHVGYCKPHPAMYLTACQQLDVEPEECLYVGDGGSRELSGARDAGLPAIRLAAPDLAGRHLVFNADVDWTGPMVPSLSDVLRLVDRVPVPV